jgi:hypothetical protein
MLLRLLYFMFIIGCPGSGEIMSSILHPGRPRRFWLILPLILLGLTLALFGLIVWASLHGAAPRFDPAAWQAARSERQLYADRYEVLADLQQHYLRPGTPRQQVLEWLGEPMDGSASEYGGLVYTIGYGPYNASAGYLLQIIFDDQGRLSETRLLEG